tara:strand:- start:190 stop:570 length:381 start_codon:yes stop_codon:yes gene_type:complete
MDSFILNGIFIIQALNIQFSSSSFLTQNLLKTTAYNINHLSYEYKHIVQSGWSQYGPLNVNVNSIRQKKVYRIFQAYNADSKPIYIAINCDKKVINVTNQRFEWKSWESPIKGFEFTMIRDLCLTN